MRLLGRQPETNREPPAKVGVRQRNFESCQRLSKCFHFGPANAVSLALDAVALIRQSVRRIYCRQRLKSRCCHGLLCGHRFGTYTLDRRLYRGDRGGADAAQVAVSAQLSGLLGPHGGELLKSVVESASDASQGVIAAGLAIITLLVSASGVFGEMQAALNQIWRVEAASTSLSALVRARAASLGLVASLGFLLLVSLLASAAISALGDVINSRLPVGSIVLSALNTLVSLLLIAVLFGAIYKVLLTEASHGATSGLGRL